MCVLQPRYVCALCVSACPHQIDMCVRWSVCFAHGCVNFTHNEWVGTQFSYMGVGEQIACMSHV